jgi:GcrA cell cycle regulator
MSRWTYEELRELVTLWPTSSASEIAKRLHRLRSGIRSKAMRLREDGLLPRTFPKHFDVNPPKRPRPRSRIMAKPPPPPVDDSLAIQPRSTLDIDNQSN